MTPFKGDWELTKKIVRLKDSKILLMKWTSDGWYSSNLSVNDRRTQGMKSIRRAMRSQPSSMIESLHFVDSWHPESFVDQIECQTGWWVRLVGFGWWLIWISRKYLVYYCIQRSVVRHGRWKPTLFRSRQAYMIDSTSTVPSENSRTWPNLTVRNMWMTVDKLTCKCSGQGLSSPT